VPTIPTFGPTQCRSRSRIDLLPRQSGQVVPREGLSGIGTAEHQKPAAICSGWSMEDVAGDPRPAGRGHPLALDPVARLAKVEHPRAEPERADLAQRLQGCESRGSA
jgi:hypothetical protein